MLGGWQQPVGDELLWQCFNAPSAVDILRITPYGSCLRVGAGEVSRLALLNTHFHSPLPCYQTSLRVFVAVFPQPVTQHWVPGPRESPDFGRQTGRM